MEPEHGRLRDWILDRLSELEMTRSDLARKLDVAPSRVSAWVNEKDMPSRERCIQLADVLGAHPTYVLALAGHEPMPETDIDLSDPLIQVAVAYHDRLTPERKRVLGDLIKSIAEEESEYDQGNGLDSTTRRTQSQG